MKVQYINSYKCVLVASAKDKLPLIIVLENTMAVMGHDGPSLPFDFKFVFEMHLKVL